MTITSQLIISTSKKSRRVFSPAVKLNFVHEFLSVPQSKYSFCKKHNLTGSDFRKWLRTFAPESEAVSKMGRKKKEDESEEVQELKRQLRLKEVELNREKMRADFYETMVDVAEEQFNISIRKKAGAKQ